jgi:cytochrome P450
MSPPIDLFDPEIRRNPYSAYAELLRSAAPQRVEPGGLWAISRHEDVQHALKHPELFSSSGFEALYRPSWLPHNPLADSLLARDGESHAKLRALVSRAFTPRSLARLEPRIREIAAECVEHLHTRGEADFIADFAVVYPARVIAEVVGVDPALHGEFRRWVDDIASISPVPPPEQVAARIRGTVAQFEGYLREVVEARRREPGDDMVSDLLAASIDGAALTDAELIAFLFVLLPAGFETTRHFFANAMLAFLERPADFAALRADPRQIQPWVEELLRHDPPAHGVLRLTTQDVDVGGQPIPAGSMVLLLLGAANRDEARFPEASRFDPTRDSQAGLAFGHGAHFCLGAPLARLEARIGLEALAGRFEGFERMPGEITWNLVPTVRGPNELPIRVRTA